jgi:hypothetical protein
VYVVADENGKGERLVRAQNASQAWRHVTKGRFPVRVASQDDLIRLRAVDVENAGAEGQAAQAALRG